MIEAGNSNQPSQYEAVREMAEQERLARVGAPVSDRIADWITAAAGSMAFVWLNAAWFAVWIVTNISGISNFDPFPFGLLTMIVSLEAIGLAIFVLISENRQAMLAERRAKLDLQVNMISEREVTKLIQIVSRIEAHLGIEGPADDEAEGMRSVTNISDLARVMQQYEEEASSKP